jgi:hypothetical protein
MVWLQDMRILILLALLLPAASFAKGVRVNGGFTKSGAYRAPHTRTSPNRSKADNWSAKGNVNPYTGKKGTR